ncbi:MAG: CBS domain-containing protein [Desulfobacteraceae bacterium 4572_130]|nr:MAG: CBS domain-containing protein [Desulfobacteraceae bacterium 4572_130]
MFIKKAMTSKVISIDIETEIIKAHEIMTKNNIRHLPVLDKDNKVIGMVTDRDIRSAMPFNLSKKEKQNIKFKAKDIMTENPYTISSLATIQDALLLIQKNKIGGLPVVDENNKLKGIVSVRDLLSSFINVLGIGEPGTLLGLVLEEKIGQLKKIVDVITEFKISMGSVLVARYQEENKRVVFIYLLTNNVIPLKKKLKVMGYTLIDPISWYI